jgi:hypothetical protein
VVAALMDEYKLEMSGNKVLRKISEHENNESKWVI